jgi:magnesium transporter
MSSTLGKAVNAVGSVAASVAGGAVKRAARQVKHLALPRRVRHGKPGAMPGLSADELGQLPSTGGRVIVSCIDYSPQQVLYRDILDLDEFVEHHRPDWSVVRWINVDGLNDLKVIQTLAKKYELHPLAVEDVLQVPQRPKVDSYPAQDGQRARLFVVTRMVQLVSGQMHSEQISMFLGRNTVLTFQETHGDVWDPIRDRIHKPGSRLRLNDASFLVYALLDAIVDHCFPILEHFGDRLVEVEEDILERPDRATIQDVHRLRRELLLLRREVWPMREVIHVLQRETHECMGENTRVYLRDVYDHAVQVIEILETYREAAMGLQDTYMTAMSNRMNEVMKVLTIMGTIFIPLTFLAGVYGMNFEYMPELGQRWAYPAFWAVCVALAGGMVLWFKRRKWL